MQLGVWKHPYRKTSGIWYPNFPRLIKGRETMLWFLKHHCGLDNVKSQALASAAVLVIDSPLVLN